MAWLLLLVLSWIFHSSVFAQLHPFPGPGTKGSAAAPSCADDFNRANGAIGANWTNNMSTATIATNAATGGSGADTIASYTAQNIGTDHFGQVALNIITGGDNAGPCVRISGTGATAAAYCYFAFTGTVRGFYRIKAGAFTELKNTTTPQTNAIGDILKLAVSGTGATVTLTFTRNSVADTGIYAGGTTTDVTVDRLVAGNFAGIGIFGNVWRVDNFSCGTGG